jgi:phospholipid/cholesterol/gamma-HCH transport system permease protein
VGELDRCLVDRVPSGGDTLTLDLSAVSQMDSAVVATLLQGWRRAAVKGGTLTLGPTSEPARRALAMFRMGEAPDDQPTPPGVFEGAGGSVVSGWEAAVQFLQLAADTTFAVGTVLLNPRKIRWKALTEQCMDIGSRALGIVGLITFLVGLTVAFQSAYQLQQFGAAIYVANLTGVSMLREMAPLMCAILVAGRSGSSIAAEIATMQVSEEIDGLVVMGLDPIDYLAVPRLMAITLMVPLLTAMADMLGSLGGVLVGVFYLDIAWNAFIAQMLSSLGPWDFISGLIKSVIFAWGIGLIGLHYGFRVRGGASEVGRTTTASVVASIFYIIIADCLFSVLFYVVL